MTNVGIVFIHISNVPKACFSVSDVLHFMLLTQRIEMFGSLIRLYIFNPFLLFFKYYKMSHVKLIVNVVALYSRVLLVVLITKEL